MSDLIRKIIHVDMDCFYAAIEMRDNPQLQGLPVAVGGTSRRSVLCTANYEARKYGVRSAMPTSKAVQLCPDLKVVPVRIEHYRQESQFIFEIFRRYTPLVEGLSFDEAFLDVTQSGFCQGSATLMAQEIRQSIFKERQLTASAGVAPNKFIAKVASALKKPNGQFVVTPAEIAEFVKNLPVEKIFGVGQKTAEKLHHFGWKTCYDIQQKPFDELLREFGRLGADLYYLSRGIDHRPVVADTPRKAFSQEQTFEQNLTAEDCLFEFKILLKNFLEILQEYQENHPTQIIKTAFVKIKFSDFQQTTIERALKGNALELYNELFANALLRQPSKTIRLIGIGVKFDESASSKFPQPDFLNKLFD